MHACTHTHTYTHTHTRYDLIALYYSFLSLGQAAVFRKQGQRGEVKRAGSQSATMLSAGKNAVHVHGGS